MPLDTLPADAISLVTERVPSEDQLTTALACKPLSASCTERADRDRDPLAVAIHWVMFSSGFQDFRMLQS